MVRRIGATHPVVASLGAVVGVSVAAVSPGWTDEPWLIPALLSIFVVMLPFAVVNGTHQLRLNLLRPH